MLAAIWFTIAVLLAIAALIVGALEKNKLQFESEFAAELRKMEAWEKAGGVWLTLQEKHADGWRTCRVMQGKLS